MACCESVHRRCARRTGPPGHLRAPPRRAPSRRWRARRPGGVGVDHSHRRVGLVPSGLGLARLRRMVVHGAPRAWRCGAVRSWRCLGLGRQLGRGWRVTSSRPLGGMPQAASGTRPGHGSAPWRARPAGPARQVLQAWPVVSGAGGAGLEPPTCCLQDSCQPSTGCWRVRSWQVRSGGLSSQCAAVGPSSGDVNQRVTAAADDLGHVHGTLAALKSPGPAGG